MNAVCTTCQKSATRVDLTVCGVCFLEIPSIAVRCWSWFSAKTQKVNAQHTTKQQRCSPKNTIRAHVDGLAVEVDDPTLPVSHLRIMK